MSESVGFVWDDRLAAYDFGRGHPLAPIRVELALRLVQEFGLLDLPHVTVLDRISRVEEDQLLSVHEPGFVDAVKRASNNPDHADIDRGLGTGDVPAFLGMHEAASRVCGATLAAARAVAEGRVQHAVNLAGGLHHAMPGKASGFCVYSDIGVAITDLLDHGVQRIAYVDVDVHHGDGVEKIFWDDPRVLTISIHESGRTLFPGTGFPQEIGGHGARGTAVNLPLPAGVGDDLWLRAFSAVVPEVLEAFAPQILVSQHGCDSHYLDPLANFNLTVDGQRESYRLLHEMAHKFCDGMWVAVGGGGYEWVDVVPRAWAHLTAIAAGRPIPAAAEVPRGYLDYVTSLLGHSAPAHMTDGRAPRPSTFDWNHNPDDAIDRAIMATRNAVFPHWGLVADPFGSF